MKIGENRQCKLAAFLCDLSPRYHSSFRNIAVVSNMFQTSCYLAKIEVNMHQRGPNVIGISASLHLQQKLHLLPNSLYRAGRFANS